MSATMKSTVFAGDDDHNPSGLAGYGNPHDVVLDEFRQGGDAACRRFAVVGVSLFPGTRDDCLCLRLPGHTKMTLFFQRIRNTLPCL